MSDSFNSWTVAHQALLSMDFFRQEHWNGLPFPVPGDLPNTGIEPASPPWQAVSCIAGRFFTTEPSVKPIVKESVSHSVLPDFLWPHGLKPTWLLCHGIFQSRILEWFSISFSRGLSQPRDQTSVSCPAGRFITIWATREALTSVKTHWMLAFHCLPFVTQ